MGADLRNAKFKGTYVDKLEVKATKFKKLEINAKLEDAMLEGTDLKGAYYDNKTLWPEGFDAKASGAMLIGDEGNPVEQED